MAVFTMGLAGFAPAATAQPDGGESGAKGESIVLQSSDRPQETRTPDVVGEEEVQLEFGMGYSTGDSDMFALPNALVRWGVSERLEVRAGLPNYMDVSNGSDSSGLTDSTLGFKYLLSDRREEDTPVGVSVLASTTLPTGEDEIAGDDDLDPSVAVQLRGNNPEGWELGAELGGSWPTFNGDREFALEASALTQGPLGENLDGFVELAGFFPEDSDDLTTLSGGVKYRPHQSGQLDLSLGTGLNDEAPDFLINAGYSVMLD